MSITLLTNHSISVSLDLLNFSKFCVGTKILTKRNNAFEYRYTIVYNNKLKEKRCLYLPASQFVNLHHFL